MDIIISIISLSTIIAMATTRLLDWCRERSKVEGHVRAMVSLNRQSHIVTRYGKFRNIAQHDRPASSPLPRPQINLAVDMTVRNSRRAASRRARSREHPKGTPRFVDPK
ncbi:hypothetical protein H4582DRAFT_1897326, partial [Lactarius indigo]